MVELYRFCKISLIYLYPALIYVIVFLQIRPLVLQKNVKVGYV